MASTRNRNTPGNFQAEQHSNQTFREYRSYETSSHYAIPTETYFPGNGLIGMKTAHRNLSENYCDVESFLFGIGSTNLVSPKEDPTPNILPKKSLNIAGRTELILPAPLTTLNGQRRMWLN
jgi:hypothetical protein